MNIINAKEMYQIENLKTTWDQLLSDQAKEENLDDLFRSYEWIDHLTTHKKNDNVWLAVEKSADHKMTGIVPYTHSLYTLKFDLKSRVLRNKSFPVNWILGNDLLLPEDGESYDNLFELLLSTGKETRGVYIESVKKDSYLWKHLCRSEAVRKNYFSYLPEGERNYYFLQLPASYDDYWSCHKESHKKDTMRKFKKIENNFGSLRLQMYSREDEVQTFLDAATEIGKKSWQYEVIGQRIRNDAETVENKKDLARRNLFRSYILYGGDQPLSCAVGLRDKRTWIGDEIAFDKSYSNFSAGWVMMCAIIENLIEQKFENVNLGVGEGAHKSRVCNRQITDFSLLLLKKNLTNLILIKEHAGFEKTKRYLKKFTDESKKR